MTSKTYDRVKETTTSEGYGPFTLSGVSDPKYRTFSSAIGNRYASVIVCIEHQTSNEWAVVEADYDYLSGTLDPMKTLSSSNGDNDVSFSAGVKDVFLTYDAKRLNTLPIVDRFEVDYYIFSMTQEVFNPSTLVLNTTNGFWGSAPISVGTTLFIDNAKQQTLPYTTRVAAWTATGFYIVTNVSDLSAVQLARHPDFPETRKFNRLLITSKWSERFSPESGVDNPPIGPGGVFTTAVSVTELNVESDTLYNANFVPECFSWIDSEPNQSSYSAVARLYSNVAAQLPAPLVSGQTCWIKRFTSNGQLAFYPTADDAQFNTNVLRLTGTSGTVWTPSSPLTLVIGAGLVEISTEIEYSFPGAYEHEWQSNYGPYTERQTKWRKDKIKDVPGYYRSESVAIKGLSAGSYSFAAAGGSAYGDSSFSVGRYSVATAGGLAGGDYSSALNSSVAFGNGAAARDYGIAIGGVAKSFEPNAIAIGAFSQASGQNSLAMGPGAFATSSNSVAIGNGASSAHANTVALNTQSLNSDEIVWGTYSGRHSRQVVGYVLSSPTFSTDGGPSNGVPYVLNQGLNFVKVRLYCSNEGGFESTSGVVYDFNLVASVGSSTARLLRNVKTKLGSWGSQSTAYDATASLISYNGGYAIAFSIANPTSAYSRFSFEFETLNNSLVAEDTSVQGFTFEPVASGGGASFNVGTATLTAAQPADELSVVVNSSAVTANSVIVLAPSPTGTADHTADEHRLEDFKLSYSDIVPGSSFTIHMTCNHRFGLTGTWAVRWSING